MPRNVLIQGDECGCFPWSNANFPDFHSRIKANTLSSINMSAEGTKAYGTTNIINLPRKTKKRLTHFGASLIMGWGDGRFLLVIVATGAVVGVVGENGVGNSAVGNDLNGAVVVFQELGREFGGIVAVHGAIDAHNALYK